MKKKHFNTAVSSDPKIFKKDVIHISNNYSKLI